MLRSEINAAIERAKSVFLANGFHLPTFAFWTPEEWAQLMYKHLDHHLRQFGV